MSVVLFGIFAICGIAFSVFACVSHYQRQRDVRRFQAEVDRRFLEEIEHHMGRFRP